MSCTVYGRVADCAGKGSALPGWRWRDVAEATRRERPCSPGAVGDPVRIAYGGWHPRLGGRGAHDAPAGARRGDDVDQDDAMCLLEVSQLVAVTVDQVGRVLAGLWLMAMAGR